MDRFLRNSAQIPSPVCIADEDASEDAPGVGRNLANPEATNVRGPDPGQQAAHSAEIDLMVLHSIAGPSSSI